MKNLTYLLMFCFCSHFANAQEKSYYRYGQNGIEIISKVDGKTIVVSTYNAKMTIKDEIARIIYDKFLKNEITEQPTFEVIGTTARVIGKTEIKIVKNLISVNFYYQTVFWNNGLVEQYKSK